MSKRQINTKSGFTIIEVVLVLAIAGLIFMMVFLALPALQRAQRDTQRSDDIARLQAAINSYQANNRGKIPDGTGVVAGSDNKDTVKNNSLSAKNWANFYANYLLVGSGGQTDVFEDPDGSPYGLHIVTCAGSGTETSTIPVGGDCKTQPMDYEFDTQSSGETSGNVSGVNHAITIVTGAVCNGEKIIASSGARKVAIAYKKEGGGAVCLNN